MREFYCILKYTFRITFMTVTQAGRIFSEISTESIKRTNTDFSLTQDSMMFSASGL